ncbi:hypothetical protein LTR33_008813 [Friedmanniomyces endolithicus]|nr:hypothetical protein LTR33_008813 [Friedmanniomyces endolithicus]
MPGITATATRKKNRSAISAIGVDSCLKVHEESLRWKMARKMAGRRLGGSLLVSGRWELARKLLRGQL